MADALDSKSSDRKVVGVQVPPPVLFFRGRGSVAYNWRRRLIRKSTFPGAEDFFALCCFWYTGEHSIEPRATQFRKVKAPGLTRPDGDGSSSLSYTRHPFQLGDF